MTVLVRTARNARLHEIYLAWSQWSSSVGLCENLAKYEVSAVGKRKTEDACQVFDPSRVPCHPGAGGCVLLGSSGLSGC